MYKDNSTSTNAVRSHYYDNLTHRFRDIDKYGKDVTLFILLSVFLVASQTWAFKSDVLLSKIEFFIRLLIPIILLVCFKKFKVPYKGRFLIILYGILAFYTFLMAIFSEKPDLVIQNTAKYLYILTFPVALLLIIHPRNTSYYFLYVSPFLGLLFSIQTIILFILIQTGNPPPSDIKTLVGYKNMEVLSYGLWGYAHGMMAIGSEFQLYRAQSFFGEPTRLASFLEVSTIMAFGLYKINKDRKMFVISMLCFISLVMTFSMTAYVVIFLTICVNYAIKYRQKFGYLKPIVASGAIFCAVIVILFYLQVATEFYNQSESIFNMAFGHSPMEVTYRVNSVADSARLFLYHPFGIGLIGVEDSSILENYPDAGGLIAPLVWLAISGIVGFVLQFVIIIYVLKNIVINHIRIVGKIERYLGLSFVALILHHCLAGDWFDAMFFYLLTCIIVTDTYKFSFNKYKLKNSFSIP